MGTYIYIARTHPFHAKVSKDGSPVYPWTYWEKAWDSWGRPTYQERLGVDIIEAGRRIPREVQEFYTVVTDEDARIRVGDSVYKCTRENGIAWFDTDDANHVGYVRGVSKGVVDIDFDTSNPLVLVGTVGDGILHFRDRYTGEEAFSVMVGEMKYTHQTYQKALGRISDLKRSGILL